MGENKGTDSLKTIFSTVFPVFPLVMQDYGPMDFRIKQRSSGSS
jgi:hypothetical protein